MKLLTRLETLARNLKRELDVYQRILRHPRTPWPARVLLWAALGYLVSPFDLIPDFIPVVGHLDDVVIVPALVIVALKMAPADVVTECRALVAAQAGAGAA